MTTPSTHLPKVNYLTNRELLKEIHNSKMSYCHVTDKKYDMFDVIVHSLDEISDELIASGRQNRADRIAYEHHKAAHDIWVASPNRKQKDKPRPIDFKFDGSQIPLDGVVFRLMTFEHIPIEKGRKKTPKSTADAHSKCNFPPFKHYAYVNNTLTEVARSHWKGDFEHGVFSNSHGQINNRLARMLMLLCKRYSMRGNWRGYSYVDEMRSQALLQLSQVSLYFDESKSQNPFAYLTSTVSNSFTRVFNIEKRNQEIRDDLLIEHGQMPSYSRQLADDNAFNDNTLNNNSDY
jgi:hypothetical protein